MVGIGTAGEIRAAGVARVAWRKLVGLGSDEGGAALVMTLAMCMMMYLAVAAVFTAATAVRERVHLQNAADAAAYSAAVIQADTLSRIATINRAMAWTYVQMTRRQMDYIVYKWLDCTYAHYKKDHETAEHNHSQFGICNGALHTSYVNLDEEGRFNHYEQDQQYIVKPNGNIIKFPPWNKDSVQLNGLSTFALPEGGGLTSIGTLVRADGALSLGFALTAGGASVLNGVMSSGDSVALTAASGSGALVSASGVKTVVDGVSSLANVSGGGNFASYADTLTSFKETIESMKDVISEAAHSDKSYSNKSGVKRFMNVLKAQILCDRLNIAAMNVYIRRLALDMPGKIDNCVEDVIKANVPHHMLGQCRYFLQQNRNPLADEEKGSDTGWATFLGLAYPDGFGGYLCNLHNNPTDERRFVKFAGSEYDQPLVDIFKKSVLAGENSYSQVACGLEQWFVRGNGKKRTDNAVGIQRSYKHWPEQSGHMAYNPSMPSCYNEKNLHGSPQSYALHSQWQWYARNWICFYFPPTPFTGEFSIHVPIPLWKTCEFHGEPGLEFVAGIESVVDWVKGIADIGDYVGSAMGGVERDDEGNVTEDPDLDISDDYKTEKVSATSGEGGSRAADKYEYGCLTTMDGFVWNTIDGIPVPIPLFSSYARLYADDKHLYNKCYVGERAKPLVMRQNYFGRDGTIVVGLARKNENVWKRIFISAMGGGIEGLFKAFDPTVLWSWAFSAAKAGYRDVDSDVDKRDYRIDWQEDNQEWNLCQSDWDAVFVPVRQAETLATERIWTFGSGKVLKSWVSGKWQQVGDDAPEPEIAMEAPPGMAGSSENLDWGALSDALYH